MQRDVYADMNVLSMNIVATTLFGGEGVEDVGPAITTAFDFFGRRGSSMLISECVDVGGGCSLFWNAPHGRMGCATWQSLSGSPLPTTSNTTLR